MSQKFLLVEHTNCLNGIIQQTLQSTKTSRLKFTCVDISKKYIVCGANSGGIYIFQRDPGKLLKIVPNPNGPVALLSICHNEEDIAFATINGIVCVLQNCFILNAKVDTQVYSDHEGNAVTYLKWNGDDLYSGDDTGIVAVISPDNFISKSIFKPSSASLMYLESGIVQLDAFSKYLLVSTETRTFICDTEYESYKQIGQKLRDGQFGACFCPRFDMGNVTTIFCARPGTRLWQANLNGEVLFTHQFRGSLNLKSEDILHFNNDENDNLIINTSDKEYSLPLDMNFSTILTIRDKFILTFNRNAFYIFNPSNSVLVMWREISNIRDIKIDGCNLYIWQNDCDIRFFSIYNIEEIVMDTFLHKKLALCTELVIKYSSFVTSLLDDSLKSQLLHVLKTEYLENPNLLNKIEEILTPTKLKINNAIIERTPVLIINNDDSNTKIIQKPKVITPVPESDEEAEFLHIFQQQYKLHKVHKNIEIPQFRKLIKSLNVTDIVQIFNRLNDSTEYSDEIQCQNWSYENYLKFLVEQKIPLNGLNQECLDFTKTAFFQLNNELMRKYSCTCGFPLPAAKLNKPQFCDIGLELMKILNVPNEFTSTFPFMYRYLLIDANSLDLSLLIQYNDVDALKMSDLKLSYDQWDECLSYLIKLKNGQCLNCSQYLNDSEGIMDWNEFAIAMVHYLGSELALKLLQQYSVHIPNGDLNTIFYQYCIMTCNPFSSTDVKDVLNTENTTKLNSMTKDYLAAKLTDNSNLLNAEKSTFEKCHHCGLTSDRNGIKSVMYKLNCSHFFHATCLVYHKGMCCNCNSA